MTLKNKWNTSVVKISEGYIFVCIVVNFYFIYSRNLFVYLRM